MLEIRCSLSCSEIVTLDRQERQKFLRNTQDMLVRISLASHSQPTRPSLLRLRTTPPIQLVCNGCSSRIQALGSDILNACVVDKVDDKLYMIDMDIEQGSHFVECILRGEEGNTVEAFRILIIFST